MKELWIFTDHFPTGDMENSVGHELPALRRYFSRIRVFPLFVQEGVRPMPEGVEMHAVIDDPYASATPWQVLRNWGAWSVLQRAVRRSAPDEALFLGMRRTNLSRMRQALRRTLIFREAMAAGYDPQRVVLYSNWALDWATVLGLWKLMDPRVRFFTRMRGFDLFDHRVPGNWQVFQSFHLAQAQHVYTVSAAGRDHIVERYPQHAAKVSVSHTATFDHGQAPWSPADALRIVSCSNMIGIKRVALIARAIARLPFPVQWTHFGDGIERPAVDAIVAAMPPHIRVDLRGAVSNQDILDHYAHRPVDLFVHASETEGGVAVALQEAASFGIPLLAADGGGVRELVNSATGELLPNDLTEDLLVERITAWHARGYDAAFRKGVRAHWLERFEAGRVHDLFARDIHDR